MADHNELGKRGEDIAAAFLKEQGYKILARNWRYMKEEIDIIATINKELVFAEVKTRSGDYFDAPENSVTNSKQKYLVNAAEAYIKKNDIDLESRFDVITVLLKGNSCKVNHIPSAFYPVI